MSEIEEEPISTDVQNGIHEQSGTPPPDDGIADVKSGSDEAEGIRVQQDTTTGDAEEDFDEVAEETFAETESEAVEADDRDHELHPNVAEMEEEETEPIERASDVEGDECLAEDYVLMSDDNIKVTADVLEGHTPSAMMDEEKAVSHASPPVPIEEPTKAALDDPASEMNRNPVGEINQEVFYDHFTLPSLSTDVRFRATNCKVRVYPNYNSQLVLEESLDDDKDGERKITAKKVEDGTTGLRALRALYTLVCVFFTGFLIVASIQLLLFLVLDVTIELGATEVQDIRAYAAVGTILAIPLFIWGLSSGLVIAGHFIGDAWHGHALVKRFVFGRFKGVLTEWFCFFIFLGIPIFTMSFALLAGSDRWWEVTALVWFSCVAVYFTLFSITVVYFEVQACLEVMRNTYEEELLEIIERTIFLRQQHFYSGTRSIRYVARGDMTDTSKLTELQKNMTHRTESVSLYSKFTQWNFLQKHGLFRHLDEPIRVYTIEDTQGVRPYVTANSWSLEKMYCRARDSRYVAITKGRGALTKAQLTSSLVCAILGNFMTLLLFISLLVWLGLGTGSLIAILVLLTLFCALPGLRTSYSVYQLSRGLLEEIEPTRSEASDLEFQERGMPGYSSGSMVDDAIDPEGNASSRQNVSSTRDESCEGIYGVHEIFRITQPTEVLCGIMLTLETFLLFLYPAICLFQIGNYTIGVIFVVVGAFTWIRDHLNAGLVLEIEGNLDSLSGKTLPKTWQKRSRLNTIVSNISRSRSRKSWVSVLFVFVIALLSLFAFAVLYEGTEGVNSRLVTPVRGYKYVQQEDLEYPTCKFGKGLSVAGFESTQMIDYVYVATAAYQTPNLTQGLLDEWFGPGIASDEQAIVEEFREEENVTSPVSFKLIYFEEYRHAVVSIRGTIDAWDALADAQLWGSAAIFQGLRFVLPFGEIWNPILDNLVRLISWLESSSIDKVSFYRDTTKFVEYLKANKTSLAISSIQLTGHSLGGGLAIISGAQTGTPTVAVSAPNAKLSRLAFTPTLSLDALNTKVFNIIPDRDIVPRLDDRGRLFQEIRCTAPLNSFAGCHRAERTLCEVMYTCGNNDRPVICECNKKFGYDPPIPIDGSVNITFEEACKNVVE